MSTTISISEIYDALENTLFDLEKELDDLEGEAPEYMNFSKIREVVQELKENEEAIKKWMENIDIKDIQVRNW